METKPRVIEVLRRFLPGYLRERKPTLSPGQRRALWAIQHCRTAELGGHVHKCDKCGKQQYHYHSCNHKACPQCGGRASWEWVAREQEKRVGAPYFMVTFTVPEELRWRFLSGQAKDSFDVLFTAASRALAQCMRKDKALRAEASGFTMVLHTWNQQMLPHIHIHAIVPGCGLDEKGNYREVKSSQFLVDHTALQKTYRWHFSELMKKREWGCDPAVWTKDWSVRIDPFGSGKNAIQYLGRYVSRSVIGNSRILSMTEKTVTFEWKDRQKNGVIRQRTISGEEFCVRYLRHVLPLKLRAVRYYGFCHPAQKRTRLKVAILSGKRACFEEQAKETLVALTELPPIKCPCCDGTMQRMRKVEPRWKLEQAMGIRGPPTYNWLWNYGGKIVTE